MKRSHLLLISGLCLLISPAIAIIDTNENGLSDLWEKQHNHDELFPETFDPEADPDQDGWTNAQEAAAGTHPHDPNAPEGFIRPEVVHYPAVIGEENGQTVVVSPEAITVTWPTLVGKQYTVLISTDLTGQSWTPAGPSFIGDGDIHEFGFPFVGVVDKHFCRVAVTDTDTDGDTLTDAEEHTIGSSTYLADSDSDGLTDFEEFVIHLTSPNSSDSDSDGVPDRDEVIVNSTDPNSANDTDNDGMPDDLEIHLAKQLLLVNENSEYWGEFFAGLVEGNLDPSHDYTGDGQGIGAFLPMFCSMAASASSDQEIRVESKFRFNTIVGYLDADPEDYPLGSYSYSTSDGSSSRFLQSSNEMSESYLNSQLTSIPYLNETAPAILPGSSLSFSYLPWSVIDDVAGTRYAYKCQKRFRIVASKANHSPFRKTFLKVTYRCDASLYNMIGASEAISTEIFEIDLPNGRLSTPWFEMDVPFEQGYHTFVRLVPIEIDFIDPDDQSWLGLVLTNNVFLSSKPTRVRIRIDGVELSMGELISLGLSEIHLKTMITRDGLGEIAVPLSDTTCTIVSDYGVTEIRMELNLSDFRRLALLPDQDAENLAKYSTLDHVLSDESNFDDSQAFIDRMTVGGRGKPAGYANNKPNVSLESSPPQSDLHETFLQAAGAEVLSARFGMNKKLGLVMNQGEVFYFSGHGFPGNRANGPQFGIGDSRTIDGMEIKPHWDNGLHIAVISGCSVVNVNNLNPNPDAYVPATIGPDAGYYPGEFMNGCGPRFVLGYGSSAPTDSQNTPSIVTSFVDSYITSPATPFISWSNANDNPNGRNATAIEKDIKFGYFERIIVFGVTVDYVWNELPFEEW